MKIHNLLIALWRLMNLKNVIFSLIFIKPDRSHRYNAVEKEDFKIFFSADVPARHKRNNSRKHETTELDRIIQFLQERNANAEINASNFSKL